MVGLSGGRITDAASGLVPNGPLPKAPPVLVLSRLPDQPLTLQHLIQSVFSCLCMLRLYRYVYCLYLYLLSTVYTADM